MISNLYGSMKAAGLSSTFTPSNETTDIVAVGSEVAGEESAGLDILCVIVICFFVLCGEYVEPL